MISETKLFSLKDYGISPERGMLADPDPTFGELPPPYHQWEEMAGMIRKLLVTDRCRSTIQDMPLLNQALLMDDELPAAMRALSFMGHAYVWADPNHPARYIPASVAVPWYDVAKCLGRPPVLSYDSYCLHDWQRIDQNGPIALGNIALLQNFMSGIDEEWFVLVHVDIEAKAAAVFKGIEHALAAMARDEISEVDCGLQTIAGGIEQMFKTLCRMPEYCDPYIYYHRVRPYLFGWKNNPALPDGMIYEGVEEYGGKPQKFRGETGAQTSIVPALDAALRIAHKDDPLRPYLLEMRNYMPPKHRMFIEALEQGPSLRAYVEKHRELIPSYDSCVTLLDAFRLKHLEYGWKYIGQWEAKSTLANPTEVGTGGTPFIPYLKKHQMETRDHLLEEHRVCDFLNEDILSGRRS